MLAKPHHQSGVVMFLFVFVVSIGAAGIYAQKQSRDAENIIEQVSEKQEMNHLKGALLGYANMRVQKYGGLPCPDTNGDGVGDLAVGGDECLQNRGWVPFKQLSLPDLRDRSQERFWYAVDQLVSEVNATEFGDISDVDLVLNVDEELVAAVIIAPQKLTSRQRNRVSYDAPSVNSERVIGQYLESTNSNRNQLSYISKIENNTPFNDVVLTISLTEINTLLSKNNHYADYLANQ